MSFQTTFEPAVQPIKVHLAGRDGDHKIVNPFVIRYVQPIGTTIDQDFHKQPCGALVTIHKPMIANHAMQQSGALSSYGSMIPRIGSRQRRLDQVKAANAVTPSVAQSFIMRG